METDKKLTLCRNGVELKNTSRAVRNEGRRKRAGVGVPDPLIGIGGKNPLKREGQKSTKLRPM